MLNTQAIVFDFDGTIADSEQATIKIFNQLSKKFNFEKSGQEIFDEYKIKGAKKLIKTLKVPLREIPALLKQYKEASVKIVQDLKPIKGIDAALKQLKQQGFTLGILTSNSEENVERFLQNNDLLLFDFIYSERSLFGKDKMMRKMMREHQLKTNSVVYVGDEIRDIEAAKKVGMPIIAVTWGFNTHKALKIVSQIF